MPTIKNRLNITLPEDVEEFLTKAAKLDDVPKATKAAQLIKIALEFEEDSVWDLIASKRDAKNSRFVTHAKAWK